MQWPTQLTSGPSHQPKMPVEKIIKKFSRQFSSRTSLLKAELFPSESLQGGISISFKCQLSEISFFFRSKIFSLARVVTMSMATFLRPCGIQTRIIGTYIDLHKDNFLNSTLLKSWACPSNPISYK